MYQDTKAAVDEASVILNIIVLTTVLDCGITTQLWERPDRRINKHFAAGQPLITRLPIVMFVGRGGG
jgi:hypothetical protein